MAQPDLKWFRDHLLTDILPNWLDASQTASGIFLPHLDREWKRVGDPVGTLVTQGRLLYNFAVGYEVTGDKAYLEAVIRGAEYLQANFYDDEHSGWHFSVDWNGEVKDDTKDSYGHAFVMFGLAHAAKLTQHVVHTSQLTLAQAIIANFVDDFGGIRPKMTRQFSPSVDDGPIVNSQNPMMHLFEACLAAEQAMKSDAPRSMAGAIIARLFGGEYLPEDGLPELYREDWEPLPTAEGGRIDIGHQFEWAYLLSRAVEMGHPKEYLVLAQTLLDYGMRVGYDSTHGGIAANASLAGTVTNPKKGWWQQCEAIRAMMHHAAIRGRNDLWAPMAQTLVYVHQHFIDPEFGGWYSSSQDQSKGNAWKVDYHVVGMCQEASRLMDMR